MTFEPGTGRLFASAGGRGGNGNVLYELDPTNGTALAFGDIGLVIGATPDLCFGPDGTLYGSVRDGERFDPTFKLITIDLSPVLGSFVGPFGAGLRMSGLASVRDSDGDGILDGLDRCADTQIPEATVPSRRLGVNRWALVDGDGMFDSVSPRGRGSRRSYTIDDTAGCSCEQIIEARGLGNGHTRFGCSNGNMRRWVRSVDQQAQPE